MRPTRPLAVAALAVPALVLAHAGAAAPFSPGNLVVVYVNDGTPRAGFQAAPVFLHEYTPTGTLVQSVALPTAPDGANAPFALDAFGSSEGALSLSADGRFLTLAGYAAPPDTVRVVGTTASAVNRVVARVDASGTVDTSTRLSGAFSTAAVRSATTDDGTRFWVAGLSADANGGIHYVEHGSAGASTQILAEPNDARVVEIHNGQLYHSGGNSGFACVSAVGTGLPAAEGQTLAPLVGMPTEALPGGEFPSPNAFVFLDASAEIPGPDLLYIADSNQEFEGGGVQRWNFDGTNWSLAYTINQGLNAGVRGLAVIPGTPNLLFATTTNSSANRLIRIEDTGPASDITVIATAAPDTAFRGVELSPAGSRPPCRADFDGNGAAQVPDIFSFLSAWFASNPAADFDGNGQVQVVDIFAFLSAWFAGC